MESDDELLKFPCDFPIKAMGRADEDFDSLVVEIIQRHVDNLSEGAVTCRASSNGRYLAVTVTIQAASRAQLDAIYQDLSRNKRILMAL